MRIRKTLGNAVRLAIVKSTIPSTSEIVFYDGHKFIVQLVPIKDTMTQIVNALASHDGRVTYAVRISAAETLQAYSKWTWDGLRTELSRSDGICLIHGEKATTVFSFSGEPAMVIIHGVIRKLHGVQSRPRDSQREKLYDFEHRVLNPVLTRALAKADVFGGLTHIGQKRARSIASRITKEYGLEDRVELLFSETRSESRLGRSLTIYSDVLDDVVDFWRIDCHPIPNLPGKVSVHTLLHELAHVISNAEAGRRNGSGHGDQFTATYIELLNVYVGMDIGQLVTMFRDNGLKVDTHSIFDYANGSWFTTKKRKPTMRCLAKRSKTRRKSLV